MTFGMTPQGFNAPRLADLKQILENAMIAQFGPINTDSQSVMGQLIGVMAKQYADIWENLESVYFSQYPNSAYGVSLDNVVALNGITRLPQTQTMVTATCTGLEGTYIPINSNASIPSNGNTFYASVGGFITAQNADSVIVQIQALTTQAYTVNLNNSFYTYSLPVITFSNVGNIFQAGQSIVVNINGVNLTAVSFSIDSNTTLANLASAIAAFIAGTTATPTNPNIITITPPSGSNVNINSISITGPGTIATYAITYLAPASNNALTSALTAIINAGTPPWTCIDNVNGTITINANVPSIPFIASTGVNLAIIAQSSPITFFSSNFGPIPCPIGALTYIVTPIAGWESITNLVDGTIGSFIETDAQLRIRRYNSIKLLGTATVSAIQAQVLQYVQGVTNCIVFENRTLTEQSITIVFPLPFNIADTISVTYNTLGTFAVPFSVNQATTMNNLTIAFEALPQVASATYGGPGNQTLTVNMNILQSLIVNSVITDISAQTANLSGGRPIKSFETVVQGGNNYAVANQIWLSKPAGIETFGNTSQIIIDSEGNNQTIYFSRPTQIYIWVQVALTLYTEEPFPSNGAQLVQEAIFNYGSNLGVGVSVLLQRVLAQIFTVSGIASGSMTIAATFAPDDSPSFGSSDITIADNQISVWDLLRINVTVL